jgi:hypothetical protein
MASTEIKSVFESVGRVVIIYHKEAHGLVPVPTNLQHLDSSRKQRRTTTIHHETQEPFGQVKRLGVGISHVLDPWRLPIILVPLEDHVQVAYQSCIVGVL